MQLGCRTMWKTNKQNGFSPAVIVRVRSWIPPAAGTAGERASFPASRRGGDWRLEMDLFY